ncbi:MAG: hypothetical protein Q8O44_01205 [Syntrophales bacterium]|nr:hypothetical protein [Syntrophales bacterium]
MEVKKKSTYNNPPLETESLPEGKGKIATYVYWIIATVLGPIILFTVFMAAYRKLGD